MIRVDRAAAWVLHRRAWRDSSLILELFCRDHGRVAVVARGARSPRSAMFGLVEPFRPVEASWSRRGEMGTLTGLEPGGAPLRLSGRALLCGLYANELLLRLLPRDDPEPEVFEAYVRTLPALSSTDDQAPALRAFEYVLLASIGVLPDLEYFSESGEEVEPGRRYRIVPGSGVEPVGSGRAGIDGAVLRALAAPSPIPPESLPVLRAVMRELIDHQLDGRPLSTPALLRGA